MANKEEKVLQSGVLRRRVAEQGEGANPVSAPPLAVPAMLHRCLAPSLLECVTAVSKVYKTIRFDVSSSYSLPGLPEGYYFKGGAAREQLRAVLELQLVELFSPHRGAPDYCSEQDSGTVVQAE